MSRLWYLNCIFLSLLLLNFGSLSAADGIDLMNTPLSEGADNPDTNYSGSTIETGADRTPGDGKGVDKGQYMVENIRDEQGNVISQNLWVEDKLIQTLGPDSIDENSIKFSADKNDDLKVVRYVDKKNNILMINGFVTDIPPNANIVKLFVGDDGKSSIIVWQDSSGGYHKTEVPDLSTLPKTPAKNPTQLPSEELTEGELEANGFTGDQSSSSTASSDSSSSDGNNTPDINDSSDSGSSTNTDGSTNSDGTTAMSSDSNNDSSSSGTNGSTEEEPINVPPIDQPGNKYGVDPVMSDSDVEAIVNAEIAAAKAAYKGDGLSLNDWGVAQGSSSTTQIQHSGKIDGFATPIHYWLSQAAARGKVVAAAGTKRAGLEKDRQSKIDKIKKDRQDKKSQQNATSKPSSTVKPSSTSNSSASSSTVRPSATVPTPPVKPASTSTSTTPSLGERGAASEHNTGTAASDVFE